MDISEESLQLIGQPEGQQLEYKAVLPPSRVIGQIVCAFANASGGFLVLGVIESKGELAINGLSSDFQANSITHKAIDLLSPKPTVYYQYVTYGDKRLYVIKVEPSPVPILIEDKKFVRQGSRSVLENETKWQFKKGGYPKIAQLAKHLDRCRQRSTGAKSKFIEHYLSVLSIVDDLGNILYPVSTSVPTKSPEGRILMRILFSSCADNFETYLLDLLYEIYLANPASLKSEQQVSIREVLECADMQEFVIYWSKKKLGKLQRGSVKGFIAENPQIKSLNVIDSQKQDDIEKILQVRHLYAHRNGIVDEKFLQFYPGKYNVNDLHEFSVEEMLQNLRYLLDTVDSVDNAAIDKFKLAT